MTRTSPDPSSLPPAAAGGSLGSLLYMAEAHVLNEQYDEALLQYKEARELDENSREAREGEQLVIRLKRRSLEVDHYKVLNVSRSATEREIKRAYHKLAVIWHPDKYTAKNDADAAEADAKFKQIARAYEVLGDEELRRKYDLGEVRTPLPSHHLACAPDAYEHSLATAHRIQTTSRREAADHEAIPGACSSTCTTEGSEYMFGLGDRVSRP